MTDIATLFHDYGPTLAIAIVFVWQSIAREARMSKRLDEQEDLIRDTLGDTVVKNTLVLERFTTIIGSRPCMYTQPPVPPRPFED